MSENELATLAMDICFIIHRQYGPGLFGSVYEKLFCYELEKCGTPFLRQQSVKLVHESIKLNSAFRADIILDRKVIMELKSIEKVEEIHFKQVLTYLKQSKLKLGLLLNFNVSLMKNGIHRVVNNL